MTGSTGQGSPIVYAKDAFGVSAQPNKFLQRNQDPIAENHKINVRKKNGVLGGHNQRIPAP